MRKLSICSAALLSCVLATHVTFAQTAAETEAHAEPTAPEPGIEAEIGTAPNEGAVLAPALGAADAPVAAPADSLSEPEADAGSAVAELDEEQSGAADGLLNGEALKIYGFGDVNYRQMLVPKNAHSSNTARHRGCRSRPDSSSLRTESGTSITARR